MRLYVDTGNDTERLKEIIVFPIVIEKFDTVINRGRETIMALPW